MQFFVNDQWIDSDSVPAAFGLDEDTQRRSVFTTLGVTRGVPLFLDHHLARLRHDAAVEYLRLPDDELIATWLHDGLDRNSLSDGVVRIIAAPASGDPCALRISFEPPRPTADSMSLLLMELPPSESRSIKRMWRKDWEEAIEVAHEAGCTDVLATVHGKVAETSVSNIFVDTGERLVTPPADGSILPGIARGRLLATGMAAESPVGPDDLTKAHAVFVTNSVRGVMGINRILSADGRIIYEGANEGCGAVQHARKAWERLLGQEIALNSAASHYRRQGPGG